MWPLYLVVLYCDDTWGNTIYTKHISYLYSRAKKVRVDRITAFIVDDDDETQIQIGIVVVLTSLPMGRYRRIQYIKEDFRSRQVKPNTWIYSFLSILPILEYLLGYNG